MPLFRETEVSTCYVTWFRVVEAETLAEAEQLFREGNGEPDGHSIGDYMGMDPISTVAEVVL